MIFLLMLLLNCTNTSKKDAFDLLKSNDPAFIEQNSIDPNAIDAEGHTMMYYALKNRNTGFLSFLWDLGGDIGLRDALGNMLFDYILENDDFIIGPLVDAIIDASMGIRSAKSVLGRKYTLKSGKEVSIEDIAREQDENASRKISFLK